MSPVNYMKSVIDLLEPRFYEMALQLPKIFRG